MKRKTHAHDDVGQQDCQRDRPSLAPDYQLHSPQETTTARQGAPQESFCHFLKEIMRITRSRHQKCRTARSNAADHRQLSLPFDTPTQLPIEPVLQASQRNAGPAPVATTRSEISATESQQVAQASSEVMARAKSIHSAIARLVKRKLQSTEAPK